MNKSAFVIIAPNSMAFRAIVNSDTLPILQQKCDAEGYSNIFVLSPDNGTQNILPHYVEWRDFQSPSLDKSSLPLFKRIYRSIRVRLEGLLGCNFKNIAFRFNEINQFYAHQFKKKLSTARQNREEIAGNFVKKRYGFPFPKSHFLYKCVTKLYYAKPFVIDPNIEGFFHETSIDRMIFHYAQHDIFREYMQCAKKFNIPYTSIIGSWDRLTTKGPICPNSQSYIVNTQVMANELKKFHNINKNKIHIIGWPQMDAYHDLNLQLDRDSFCEKYGIASNNHILLFAGNSERLGQHEPSIVEHICHQINNGHFSKLKKNIHLIIRPHPLDNSWQERFKKANNFDFVTLMPAEMQNLSNMVNTLLHSDTVIATQGSITLDATAFDKPVINLNFDGDLIDQKNASVKRLYKMDHYLPVLNTGAIYLVDSYANLDNAVINSLEKPDGLKDQRLLLRQKELEPFLGDSSQRQVKAMLS